MTDKEFKENLSQIFKSLPKDLEKLPFDKGSLMLKIKQEQVVAKKPLLYNYFADNLLPLSMVACLFILMFTYANFRLNQTSYEELMVDSLVLASLPSSLEKPKEVKEYETH